MPVLAYGVAQEFDPCLPELAFRWALPPSRGRRAAERAP